MGRGRGHFILHLLDAPGAPFPCNPIPQGKHRFSQPMKPVSAVENLRSKSRCLDHYKALRKRSIVCCETFDQAPLIDDVDAGGKSTPKTMRHNWGATITTPWRMLKRSWQLSYEHIGEFSMSILKEARGTEDRVALKLTCVLGVLV